MTPELYKETIPFLRQIPDQLYYSLDFSEFHLPTGLIAVLRELLETELGQYVMTYNAYVFNRNVPIQRHLCANVKGAELTETQLARLTTAETLTIPNGVRLVIYQNPLTFIKPEESTIYEYKMKR
jgi:hypothetical protein